MSDFDDVDAEFALFRSMAEASGRPLSFSLAGVDPAKYPRQLELLEEANAAGVPMRGQAAARAIGILVGLQCTVNVLAGNPVWQEIAALSGTINSPAAPFSFSNPSLSGQISLGEGGTLALNGITLGVINLPAAGPFPGGPVTIKADLIFTGIVPEPGTALLLGTGLAGLAARGRRSRS